MHEAKRRSLTVYGFGGHELCGGSAFSHLLAYRRMVVVAWKPHAQSSGKGVAANHGSGVHPCLLLAVPQQHQHRQKGLYPNLLDSSGI